MSEYVNNERLREVVNQYNDMNLSDDGVWCADYKQRLDNKKINNKINDIKYKLGVDFVTAKIKKIEELHRKYASFSELERMQFNAEFRKVKNELCDMIYKIAHGRVASFKLYATLRNPDDINDIVQDAMICVFKYINRYDADRGSSAFAFITQIITNSIILSLSNIRQREKTMIGGLDFFDNINTIDELSDGVSGISKFIE